MLGGSKLSEVQRELSAGQISRRDFVRRAAALDAEAGRSLLASRQASNRAATLDQRARRSEQLAQRAPWNERSRLLDDADRLRNEAAIARSDADQQAVRAATLRREARLLRVRAQEIAGGGSGWRHRRVAGGTMI